MPVDNGGFEEAGVRAGEPRAWRLRAVVRANELAVFGDPAVGRESFEWLALRRVLLPADIVRAMFGATAAESFASWAIGAAMTFADVASASASFDGVHIERFGPGWNNPVFARSWSAVASQAADFGVGPADAFDVGWPGTAPRLLVWTDVTSAPAMFDGEVVEPFRASWPPI